MPMPIDAVLCELHAAVAFGAWYQAQVQFNLVEELEEIPTAKDGWRAR